MSGSGGKTEDASDEPDLKVGPMSVDDFLEYSEELEEGEPKRGSLRAVGQVLDSRWMLAIAVLSVLAAIGWAYMRPTPPATAAQVPASMPRVELLGVPDDAEVTLDGERIDKDVFGVAAGSRHALEVRHNDGSHWRQVFTADGSVALVVDLQVPLVENAVVPPTPEPRKIEPPAPASAQKQVEAEMTAKPKSTKPKVRAERTAAKRRQQARQRRAKQSSKQSSDLVRDPGF